MNLNSLTLFFVIYGVVGFSVILFLVIKLHSQRSIPSQDSYEVLRVGNLTIAQGYKCSDCGLIRAYHQPICVCRKRANVQI